MPRVLDLCCGAGGVSVGLAAAGFEVWGVDLARQPHYPFPTRFLQADALALNLAFLQSFDALWASWPCQGHTTLRAIWGRSYPDLIPTGRAMLQATGRPWIIENVVGAPLCDPILLCGTMFDLKVFRHRLFESNCLLLAPSHRAHQGSTGSHRWPYVATGGYVQITGTGGNFTRESGSAAMGIDWMTKAELAQAIPPAYATYLGRQLIRYCAPAQQGDAA